MPKRPVRPDDLLRFVLVGDPQLSPDGGEVLFTKRTVDEKNATVGQLWSVGLGGNLRQWTSGEKGAGGGRWSPDGSRIFFTSAREGSAQVYAIPTSGGEAWKLTSFEEGSIGDVRVSPDGTKLALTYRPAMPGDTKAAKKLREERGLSEPPVEIDHVLYRYDGDGYFANERYALVVVDAATGEATKLLDTDPHGSYDFDWSPDSSELAVVHNATDHPFVDPPNRQIWRVSMDGKAAMIQGLPKGVKGEPRWSPDGRWIAYAGDVDEDDPWGTRNTKLYVVSPDGGEAKDLTGSTDYDLSVATLSDTKDAGGGAVVEWAADSSGLYVQVGWHGEQQLGWVSLAGGVELLTEGRHTLSIGNARGTRVAATWGDATRVPEIAIIEPELATGRMVPKLLTDLNHDVHEELEIVAPEEVWIDTTDGLRVHGWVLRPGDGSPSSEERAGGGTVGEGVRSPVVLQVHGGPHTQYGWAFFHEFQCQVAEGYTVVYTNPRGSKGYGEAWTAAIRGDWGHKDWEDVNAVADWIRARPVTGKVAIMGGSYGGYMTNWAIGHRHDWACAITDRCVSNFVSMAGNSDFPLNKDGYFGGVAYGNLDDIAGLWRQSPIAHFKGVTTPTLVIHSVGDLRCNIEQSEQVFAALQMQGVPSRFVRYPVSTSHGMSRSGPPDLRQHRLREILGWLGRYLK